MGAVRAGEAPLVSIVTVTWNAPEWASRLYTSLAARTPQAYELIVVDNASDEPMRELNRSEAAAGRLRLVQNEDNRLWAAGCNQGLELVDPQSRYVLLLNPDCEVLAKTSHRGTPAECKLLERWNRAVGDLRVESRLDAHFVPG